MNQQIIVKTRINSDIETVWNYYTLPEHITQWNFADPSWHCPTAENDLQVDGKYKARMEAKDGSFGFDFEAIYTDIIPGKHFTYEFGGRKSTVSFESIGDETEVSVSFNREEENSIELQKNGWQAILNSFKDYTERNK